MTPAVKFLSVVGAERAHNTKEFNRHDGSYDEAIENLTSLPLQLAHRWRKWSVL